METTGSSLNVLYCEEHSEAAISPANNLASPFLYRLQSLKILAWTFCQESLSYSPMTEKSSPQELIERCELLLSEATLAGRYLYRAFKGPAEALKGGRAPQTLNLSAQLPFFEECLELLDSAVLALEEPLQELNERLQEIAAELTHSEFVEEAQRELAKLAAEGEFWQAFLDKADALSSKFSLICKEERLSSATSALVQEVWQEVERIALAKT